MHMTLTGSPFAYLANEISRLRHRARHSLQRYGVAWRYARGRSTRDDGLSLLYDAEHIAGIHGLVSLSLESVTERAREFYGDVPGLADWAAEAVCRVASKHDGDGGHMVGAAEDWALDLMHEYAARDGVELRGIDAE